MIKYKKVVSKSNREMYYMNGNLVKQEAIPASIRNMLESGAEIEMPSANEPALTDDMREEEDQRIDTSEKRAPQINERGQVLHTAQQDVDQTPADDPQLTPAERICVFCGRPGERSKFLNGQTVHLCNEDYSRNTSGQIVAQIRKVNNAREASTI